MSESGAADAAAVGGIFSLAKFSFRHLRYVSGRIPREFQRFERIVSGSADYLLANGIVFMLQEGAQP